MTNLMPAVALATNTTSKSCGSALNNSNNRSLMSSMRCVVNWEAVEAECGLPYRFDIMSAEKRSISDLA